MPHSIGIESFQGQENSHCKFFPELLVVTIIVIVIVMCVQVHPVYAPETVPPHHG